MFILGKHPIIKWLELEKYIFNNVMHIVIIPTLFLRENLKKIKLMVRVLNIMEKVTTKKLKGYL